MQTFPSYVLPLLDRSSLPSGGVCLHRSQPASPLLQPIRVSLDRVWHRRTRRELEAAEQRSSVGSPHHITSARHPVRQSVLPLLFVAHSERASERGGGFEASQRWLEFVAAEAATASGGGETVEATSERKKEDQRGSERKRGI